MPGKEYLGDGVYVEYDGYQICLTTEDGISVQNTIYLDDQVYNSLVKYTKKIAQEIENEAAQANE